MAEPPDGAAATRAQDERKARLFLVLAAIFLTALLIANTVAGKLFQIGPVVLSVGVIPFPITFLLTDIEGSTALWERAPDVMAVALERHDALVDEHVGRRHGFVIKSKGEGDSTLSVFRRVTDAATAAGELQHALHTEPWPEPSPDE